LAPAESGFERRRYEGIDQSQIEELSRKVNESLIPRLSMPGFNGYLLMEAGDRVFRRAFSASPLERPLELAGASLRRRRAWTSM
jgi:hypothetical protein